MLCTRHYGKIVLHLYDRHHIPVVLFQMNSLLVIDFRALIYAQSLINIHDQKIKCLLKRCNFKKTTTRFHTYYRNIVPYAI